jgi:Bacterial Ig-like domain (group 3)/FG-GAP-like repeat
MTTLRILTFLSLLSAVSYRTVFAQSASFSVSDIDTGLSLSGPVAVGDFNSDGKPDLLVGVYPPLGIHLLIGNGDGTFNAPSLIPSSFGLCCGLAAADVNGDRKLDIIFNGGVLLGNGNGTFQAPIRSFSVASPRNPIVVDFNRDGKPDLAFADQGGGITVLLGNGDGTFGAAKNFPIVGGVEANELLAADFNHDGIPDLAASNFASAAQDGDTVSILLGNGDGTFGSPTAVTVGMYPFPLAAADFNGDGKVDLAVANYTSNSVSVLLAKGDGTFLPKTDYPAGEFPVGLAAADFNGDGRPDFAVGSGLRQLEVFLGHGDGGFAPEQDFAIANSTETLTIGDVNSDGKPDAIVVYVGGNHTLSVLLNNTKNRTSISLVSGLNPSIYGQKVTWTATVTSSSGVLPTGKVRFTANGYAIGVATLNSSGVATLTKSSLNAAIHPITAIYLGDAANLGSTSPIVNQVVQQTTSAANLTASPNPATLGELVTFTAKISSPTVTPTGPVSFTAGKTVLGTAQLSGGKATFTISSLPVGLTRVTVTYNGNSNIAKSSASVIETVQ